jgi:hypothetical protein
MNRLRMLIQLELLGLSNEARTPAISGRSGHQIVLTRYLAGSPSNRIESPKSSLSMSADGPPRSERILAGDRRRLWWLFAAGARAQLFRDQPVRGGGARPEGFRDGHRGRRARTSLLA